MELGGLRYLFRFDAKGLEHLTAGLKELEEALEKFDALLVGLERKFSAGAFFRADPFLNVSKAISIILNQIDSLYIKSRIFTELGISAEPFRKIIRSLDEFKIKFQEILRSGQTPNLEKVFQLQEAYANVLKTLEQQTDKLLSQKKVNAENLNLARQRIEMEAVLKETISTSIDAIARGMNVYQNYRNIMNAVVRIARMHGVTELEVVTDLLKEANIVRQLKDEAQRLAQIRRQGMLPINERINLLQQEISLLNVANQIEPRRYQATLAMRQAELERLRSTQMLREAYQQYLTSLRTGTNALEAHNNLLNRIKDTVLLTGTGNRKLLQQYLNMTEYAKALVAELNKLKKVRAIESVFGGTSALERTIELTNQILALYERLPARRKKILRTALEENNLNIKNIQTLKEMAAVDLAREKVQESLIKNTSTYIALLTAGINPLENYTKLMNEVIAAVKAGVPAQKAISDILAAQPKFVQSAVQSVERLNELRNQGVLSLEQEVKLLQDQIKTLEAAVSLTKKETEQFEIENRLVALRGELLEKRAIAADVAESKKLTQLLDQIAVTNQRIHGTRLHLLNLSKQDVQQHITKLTQLELLNRQMESLLNKYVKMGGALDETVPIHEAMARFIGKSNEELSKIYQRTARLRPITEPILRVWRDLQQILVRSGTDLKNMNVAARAIAKYMTPQQLLTFWTNLEKVVIMNTEALKGQFGPAIETVMKQLTQLHGALETYARKSRAILRREAGARLLDLMRMSWFVQLRLFWMVYMNLLDVVSQLAEFQRNLAAIRAIAQASAADVDRLAESFHNLSLQTVYSIRELSEVGIEVAKAGFSAKETMKITETAAKLAMVTKSSVRDAANAIMVVIRSWGFAADKADEIGDILFNAITKSRLSMEGLRTALGYVAAVASSAGVSFLETVSAMAVLTNAGVEFSKTGVYLRSLLMRLTAPTDRFKEALAKVGLTAEDVDPRLHSLAEIFKLMHERAFDVADAIEGVGIRGSTAFAILLSQSQYLPILNESLKMTGTVTNALSLYMNNLVTQLALFKNAFIGMSRAIFEGMAMPLKGIIVTLTDFMNLLASGRGKVVAEIAGIAIAIVGLSGIVSVLLGKVIKFIATLKLLKDIIALIRGEIIAINVVTRNWRFLLTVAVVTILFVVGKLKLMNKFMEGMVETTRDLTEAQQLLFQTITKIGKAELVYNNITKAMAKYKKGMISLNELKKITVQELSKMGDSMAYYVDLIKKSKDPLKAIAAAIGVLGLVLFDLKEKAEEARKKIEELQKELKEKLNKQIKKTIEETVKLMKALSRWGKLVEASDVENLIDRINKLSELLRVLGEDISPVVLAELEKLFKWLLILAARGKLSSENIRSLVVALSQLILAIPEDKRAGILKFFTNLLVKLVLMRKISKKDFIEIAKAMREWAALLPDKQAIEFLSILMRLCEAMGVYKQVFGDIGKLSKVKIPIAEQLKKIRDELTKLEPFEAYTRIRIRMINREISAMRRQREEYQRQVNALNVLIGMKQTWMRTSIQANEEAFAAEERRWMRWEGLTQQEIKTAEQAQRLIDYAHSREFRAQELHVKALDYREKALSYYRKAADYARKGDVQAARAALSQANFFWQTSEQYYGLTERNLQRAISILQQIPEGLKTPEVKHFIDMLRDDLDDIAERRARDIEDIKDAESDSLDMLMREREEYEKLIDQLDKEIERQEKIVKKFQDALDNISRLKSEFEAIQKIKDIYPKVDFRDLNQLMKILEAYIKKLEKALELQKQLGKTKPAGTPPSAPTGMQTGGLVTGFGTGDRIPALLEPGEFVLKKKVAESYGLKFLNALNNLQFPKEMFTPYQGGGEVQTTEGIKRTVNLNLVIGTETFPVVTSEEVANKLEKFLTRKRLVGRNA